MFVEVDVLVFVDERDGLYSKKGEGVSRFMMLMKNVGRATWSCFLQMPCFFQHVSRSMEPA